MESQHEVHLNDLSDYSGRDPNLTNADGGFGDQLVGHHEFTLPKADGGKDAWMFLAAGFVVEALVWGEFLILVGSKTLHADHRQRISVLIRCFTGILQHSRAICFRPFWHGHCGNYRNSWQP